MSSERTREQGLWSGRQIVAVFSLLTILCIGFYSLGLYIGRWSNAPAVSAADAEPTARSQSGQAYSVSAADTNTTLATLPEIAQTGDKYTVQVATTATEKDASELVQKLRQSGFDSAHLVTAQAAQADIEANSYTVFVGPYNLETAHQVAEELQREHSFSDVKVIPHQPENSVSEADTQPLQ
ncbi:MAG: SPOR domain-containing protein [Acidobacteriota bacterium]